MKTAALKLRTVRGYIPGRHTIENDYRPLCFYANHSNYMQPYVNESGRQGDEKDFPHSELEIFRYPEWCEIIQAVWQEKGTYYLVKNVILTSFGP